MAERNQYRPLEDFASLARTATKEIVPQADVTAGVLGRIRNRRISIDRPLAVITFGAALAAITLAMSVYPILQNMMDPIETFMETAIASLL